MVEGTKLGMSGVTVVVILSVKVSGTTTVSVSSIVVIAVTGTSMVGVMLNGRTAVIVLVQRRMALELLLAIVATRLCRIKQNNT